MDVIEAIMSRRSVRRFLAKPVGEEVLEQLIGAGMVAPSAHNEQPWHFVVIEDRSVLEEITRIHKYAQMLKESPVALAICAEVTLVQDPTVDFWVQDCAAATENVLLAANGLGLGACWLGIHPRVQRKATISKLLKLPENVEPFSIIALGYPAEQKKPADRFKQERIHKNHW